MCLLYYLEFQVQNNRNVDNSIAESCFLTKCVNHIENPDTIWWRINFFIKVMRSSKHASIWPKFGSSFITLYRYSDAIYISCTLVWSFFGG